MPQADDTAKRKGRAKNNLSSFDLSQIEADLVAVEAEALKLDPHSLRAITNDSVESAKNKVPAVAQQEAGFKPHPVNVVNFNPDNSKLLHRVLRADSTPKNNLNNSPKPNTANADKSKRTQTTVSSQQQKPKQAQPLKVTTAFKQTAPTAAKVGGMDGFKKIPTQSMEPAAGGTIGLNSVALTGMKRANQFNRFVLDQHGTSLQNQIEKQSLFERSLDGDVEIFDKGLQTNGGKKVYNVRRRKSMLGGVDQHNLGPGRLRRAFKYRPVRFLTPVFVAILIGGYVMYLNMPTINIKVAESKSGVAVSEPSYTPEGFKLSGPIEANTGQVQMNFKNGDAAYNVTQKVSDWDSKALLENKILKETKEYSAYTDRGLTIYVYDGKSTWVNQGKVYEIKLDKANLDVEEMVRIAGSM